MHKTKLGHYRESREIDMGGGVIPAAEGEDDKDAYADLLEVGEDWLAVDAEA